MVLTTDDKKLAYFIAKLPLSTEVIEDHVKELLKILRLEKEEYESQFEDPEHNLWELLIVIGYFEYILRCLNSPTFRLHIKEIETSLASQIDFLRKIEK